MKVRLVAGPLNNQDVEVGEALDLIEVEGYPYYRTGGMYSLPLHQTNGTREQWPVYIHVPNTQEDAA